MSLNLITKMLCYAASKSKMISRRQGGGDAGPPRRIEEADDAANKDSALI
jgi:hypothetical protein